MKSKVIALAAMVSALSLAAVSPALAIEVGTTNTVTQTVTTGHLSVTQVSDHWDCGYQNVFQVSGNIGIQGGLGGQIGEHHGTSFGDGDGYIALMGAGNVSFTHQEFRDHNTSTQIFTGEQTTSSSTITSATFTNF